MPLAVIDSGVWEGPWLAKGVAPNARLIDVRAFDVYGSGSHADVTRGIDWIVDNAAQYNQL